MYQKNLALFLVSISFFGCTKNEQTQDKGLSKPENSVGLNNYTIQQPSETPDTNLNNDTPNATEMEKHQGKPLNPSNINSSNTNINDGKVITSSTTPLNNSPIRDSNSKCINPPGINLPSDKNKSIN